MTIVNDRWHAHVETVADTFHNWDVAQISQIITFGFHAERYPLDRMLLMHRLVQTMKSNDAKEKSFFEIYWRLQKEMEIFHLSNIIRLSRSVDACRTEETSDKQVFWWRRKLF
jgi:hypothetical protein